MQKFYDDFALSNGLVVKRPENFSRAPTALVNFKKTPVIQVSAKKNDYPNKMAASDPNDRENTWRGQAHLENENTLHVAIRPFLIFAQLLGFMPVNGVSLSAYKTSFRWYHLRVLYALFWTAGMLCVSWLNIQAIFKQQNLNLNMFAGVFYYLNGPWTYFNFIVLARNWPKFIETWTDLEILLNANYRIRKYRYTLIVRGFCVAIIAGICIDQYLGLKANFEQFVVAPDDRNLSSFDVYFKYTYYSIFTTIPYRTEWGVLLKTVDIMTLCTSYFTDLMIIVLSFTISYQFHKITDKIEFFTNVNEKLIPINFWETIRIHYTALSSQCSSVNDMMAILILSSYMNNFFFCCIQFFAVLMGESRKKGIYLIFSISYLVIRTFATIFFSAQVHEESRRPLPYLFKLQTNRFQNSIYVFVLQITTQNLSLTGMGFFDIKRSIILSVIGVAVTYELVLIQYRSRLAD